MTYAEWEALADQVLHLDDVQLHAIVLKLFRATDAKTAQAAIGQGLAETAHYTAHKIPTTGGAPAETPGGDDLPPVPVPVVGKGTRMPAGGGVLPPAPGWAPPAARRAGRGGGRS